MLEDAEGRLHDVPRAKLPENAARGDVVAPGPDGRYTADPHRTRERRERIRRKLDTLYRDE